MNITESFPTTNRAPVLQDFAQFVRPVRSSPKQPSMSATSGKVMGKSGHSSGQFGICSGRETSERIASFLRSVYPIKTAECVSSDTGISVDTIRKWFGRESAPNVVATLRLIGSYGPEFLVAVFPSAPAWLSAAHRAEKAASIERQLSRLQAERDAL